MTQSAGGWDEPGVETVDPGVHRIPLPLPGDGLRAVNVYAIEQDDGVVLVDAGWALPASEEQLERALGQLGAGLGDVRRFLVTHIHRDHYTQAVALRRRFGGEIALGRGEQPAIEAIIYRPGSEPVRQFATLRRHGGRELAERMAAAIEVRPTELDLWEPPDVWIEAPVDLPLAARTLRALPTPGHTAGHVVFLDTAAGLLFAGDHVLPHITPSIGLSPDPGALPLGAFLDSLRMVRKMPDTRLLPAHGPVAPSVHDRVDELLDHHAGRLDAAAAAVATGADTAYAVSAVLTWTRRGRSFTDLDMFNQMLAVTETAAHLDLLAVQGRLRQETVDGIVHFAPA